MKTPSIDKPLSPKQLAFVAEYTVDHNAQRAGERAGYGAKSTRAYLLMRDQRIVNAIAEAETRLMAALNLSAEKTLRNVLRIAEQAESVADFNAALRGHELVGKYQKLWTERHEHGGVGGGPVQLIITQQDAAL